MAKTTTVRLAVPFAVLLAACSPEPEAPPAAEEEAPPPAAQQPVPAPAPAPAAASGAMPANIVAERGGFIPEGIEYDQANRRFLTGSLAEGSIFIIGNQGRVTPFIEDSELISSVGIEVDEPRDRLLVANSDRAAFEGQPGQAKLGVYNLTTGERLAMVDLAAVLDDAPADARYFANDVTVGPDGTAYVTDSFQELIYQVTPDYEAAVLHRFDLEEGQLLNGLVYHDDGYLLVAAGSLLFKVPVDDPASTTQVQVDEPVPGSDGVVWAADGRLVITSNSQDNPAVVALTSDDDWATAQRAGVAPLQGQATTAAAVGDDIYAVHPHFADQDPPSIERAMFQ